MDRQLEELLRGPNVRLKSLAVSDLLALAQPSAAQPDVVVLDLRETASLPPTLATLKRQHPGTGVVIVAARMDPVLMLEAMVQAARVMLADQPGQPLVLGEVKALKYGNMVRPGEALEVEVTLQERNDDGSYACKGSGRVRRAGTTAASEDVAVSGKFTLRPVRT